MRKKHNAKARKFKNSGYSETGASLTKKSMKLWNPEHLSAKSDIDMNLTTLRNRAAALATTPLGASAIKTQLTGVINSGLKLFPRIKADDLGLSPEAAREWNRRTKQEFELWANELTCDFYGRNNFFELQRIAYLNELNDGDCFCLFRRRIPRGDNPYSLKLQLIEAQRVSNPSYSIAVESAGKKKGSRIVNGIEVDKSGILQAIWVSNRIWNEPTNINPELSWQRVKINGEKSLSPNILHLCYDTRIEQFRGEPYLSPVIETIKNVSRYADAELTSAIIKAFFALFFEQPEANFDLNQIGLVNNDPCLDVSEYKAENGSAIALPRGVTVKAIDNSNAQSTFESFTNQFVNQISSALNLPSELVLKRFQSSYSASKAALLQAQEEFRQRRLAFVQDFCDPIYRQFLIEAVAIGRIEAPGFFDDAVRRQQWSAADWRTETSHLLDPLKEVQASALKLQLGLSTYEQEAAELCGTDFFENARQLSLERELLPQTDSIAIESEDEDEDEQLDRDVDD